MRTQAAIFAHQRKSSHTHALLRPHMHGHHTHARLPNVHARVLANARTFAQMHSHALTQRTHSPINARTQAHVHARKRTHTSTSIHTCLHEHTCARTHLGYKHAHTRVDAWSTLSCTNASTNPCKHTRANARTCARSRTRLVIVLYCITINKERKLITKECLGA